MKTRDDYKAITRAYNEAVGVFTAARDHLASLKPEYMVATRQIREMAREVASDKREEEAIRQEQVMLRAQEPFVYLRTGTNTYVVISKAWGNAQRVDTLEGTCELFPRLKHEKWSTFVGLLMLGAECLDSIPAEVASRLAKRWPDTPLNVTDSGTGGGP